MGCIRLKLKNSWYRTLQLFFFELKNVLALPSHHPCVTPQHLAKEIIALFRETASREARANSIVDLRLMRGNSLANMPLVSPRTASVLPIPNGKSKVNACASPLAQSPPGSPSERLNSSVNCGAAVGVCVPRAGHGRVSLNNSASPGGGGWGGGYPPPPSDPDLIVEENQIYPGEY